MEKLVILNDADGQAFEALAKFGIFQVDGIIGSSPQCPDTPNYVEGEKYIELYSLTSKDAEIQAMLDADADFKVEALEYLNKVVL